MEVNVSELLKAIKQSDLQAIKHFVENGGSVDTVLYHELTLLSNAVCFDQQHILIYLISKGADIHKGHIKNTPIHIAARKGNIQALEYLISCGAVNDTEKSFTPLLNATQYGNFLAVKCLVENGANVNDVEYSGCTVLMYACSMFKGELNLVQYLVEKGANVNAVDNWGRNALMYAAEFGYLANVKYLHSKGAKLNIVTESGYSAVMLATRFGHIEVLKYLLAQGASSPDQLSTGLLTQAFEYNYGPMRRQF